MRALTPALLIVVLLSTSMLAGQWPRRAAADVPRLADRSLDYDAPPPRTADGRPDLSGLWFLGRPDLGVTLPPPSAPPVANSSNIGSGWGGPPLTPWGEAELTRRKAPITTGPRGLCLPLGVMQFHTGGGPRKFVHTADVLVILYEFAGGVRQIFLDGRRIPADDPQPWFYGYSVGRWEGDTLVVETSGFRDDGWLDTNGTPLSSEARLIERIRRPGFGRMEIDVTVNDPKAFTRPWTVRVNQRLSDGDELIEFVCENQNRYPFLRGAPPRFE